MGATAGSLLRAACEGVALGVMEAPGGVGRVCAAKAAACVWSVPDGVSGDGRGSAFVHSQPEPGPGQQGKAHWRTVRAPDRRPGQC